MGSDLTIREMGETAEDCGCLTEKSACMDGASRLLRLGNWLGAWV